MSTLVIEMPNGMRMELDAEHIKAALQSGMMNSSRAGRLSEPAYATASTALNFIRREQETQR